MHFSKNPFLETLTPIARNRLWSEKRCLWNNLERQTGGAIVLQVAFSAQNNHSLSTELPFLWIHKYVLQLYTTIVPRVPLAAHNHQPSPFCAVFVLSYFCCTQHTVIVSGVPSTHSTTNVCQQSYPFYTGSGRSARAAAQANFVRCARVKWWCFNEVFIGFATKL